MNRLWTYLLVTLAVTGSVLAEDKPKEAPSKQDAPQAKAPEPKAMEPAPQNPIEAAGLDTEDKASGNWVIKKRIWEDAQTTFTKIRNINDNMLKKQLDYINNSSEVEKQVDGAFNTIGIDQGELIDLLTKLEADIEAERKEQGELSEQERDIERQIKAKQEKLKQLKLDIKAVGTLDDTIQSSVKKVSEQLKVARGYETKAWDNFKKIGQILDHVEAQKLFYEIHSYYVSVQKISDYINKGLWSSVITNINKVQPEIQKIQDGIEQLKSQGIDLKQELEKIEKEEQEREQKKKEQAEREKAHQEKVKQKKKAPKKKKASGNFFTGLFNATIGFFSSIWSVITGWFK